MDSEKRNTVFDDIIDVFVKNDLTNAEVQKVIEAFHYIVAPGIGNDARIKFVDWEKEQQEVW